MAVSHRREIGIYKFSKCCLNIVRAFVILIICYSQTSNGEDIEYLNCPGLYCGRMRLDNRSLSECSACERGYRPNSQSECLKCTSTPELYDWLYLGFMALLPLIFHSFFIDHTNKKKGAHLILHACAFIECVIASFATLLLYEPRGELSLVTCSVHQISDWYTMLYNPSPHLHHTMHCTQEIVYPLYTIVMVYYGFCLLLMLLFRLIVSRQLTGGSGTRSIYSALYFLPIIISVQAMFGGLLYYSFPYIILVVSAITNVIYLAYYDDQTIKGILREIIKSPRNIVILLSHWFLYMYGIVAVTRSTAHLPLISLFPFPTLFYILTIHFSDPDCLHQIGRTR